MKKKATQSAKCNPLGVSRRQVLKTMALAGGTMALGGFPGLSLASTAKHGGILRLGVVRGLRTINPIMHISGPDWIATKWMYNNLTKLNHRREVVPDLAESWQAADDAKTWTFKLRQGVKFHIGRELVADDVVATMQKAIDPETSAPYVKELGPIAEIQAVDKYTVKFTMSMPFADLPVTMTVPPARIVAREGLENFDALGTKEFGSGPFKLQELVTGDHLVVERFDDYFKKDQPYLD